MLGPVPFKAPNMSKLGSPKKINLPNFAYKPQVKLQQGDGSNVTSEPVAPFSLSPIVQGGKPIINTTMSTGMTNNAPQNMPKPAQLPATGAGKINKDVLNQLGANILGGSSFEEIRTKYPELSGIDDNVVKQIGANVLGGDSIDTIIKKFPELGINQKPTVDVMKGLRNAKKGLDMGNPIASALGLITATQQGSDFVGGLIDSATGLPRGIAKVGASGAEKIGAITKDQKNRFGLSIDKSVGVGQDKESPIYKGSKTALDLIQVAAPTGVAGKVGSVLGGSKLGKIAGVATEGALGTQVSNLLDKGQLASLKDTAIGAVVGGGLEGAGQLLSAGSKGIGNFLKNIRVDKKTQNALKATSPQELDDYVAVAKKASENYDAPTTFEKAARKTDDAIKKINEQKSELGKQIGSIREGVGDLKAESSKIKESFNNALEKYGKLALKPEYDEVGQGIIGADGQEMVRKVIKGYKIKPTQGVSQLPDAEQSILQDFYGKLQQAQKDGSIGSFINLKSYMGNNINKVEKASPQLQSIVGELKKSIDDVVTNVTPEQYKPLLKKYSELIDLSDNIDRFYGEGGERGSTMIKNIYGSNSMRTREFMTKIKDITGVDLYKEGALAKFVAESMGDKRGIQQFIENPNNWNVGTIIQKGVKKGLDTVSDPIDIARKMLAGPKPGKDKTIRNVVKRVAAAKASSTND